MSIKIKQRDTGNKPTRYYSKKQEEDVAKAIGGTRTKNSGATMFQKGDVHTHDWIIECKTKTSSSESMTIKKEWLEKNLEEALFMGKKNNALCFNFGPGEPNYYVIDEWMFKWLKDHYSEDV